MKPSKLTKYTKTHHAGWSTTVKLLVFGNIVQF